MGCGVLVSRMATFRPSIGWRAWVCGALTCAYAPGRDVHESGSSLKVAHSDTIRRASQRPALRPRVPALGLRCRGLSGVSVVGGEVLVSRLATFGAPIGWRVRVCGALTCAYVSGLDGHRPSVFLKVDDCDTVRRPSWWSEVRPRVLGAGG